jgi:hypothetical protein
MQNYDVNILYHNHIQTKKGYILYNTSEFHFSISAMVQLVGWYFPLLFVLSIKGKILNNTKYYCRAQIQKEVQTENKG